MSHVYDIAPITCPPAHNRLRPLAHLHAWLQTRALDNHSAPARVGKTVTAATPAARATRQVAQIHRPPAWDAPQHWFK